MPVLLRPRVSSRVSGFPVASPCLWHYVESYKISPFQRFSSRLSCRFAWQTWHFVTFQPVLHRVKFFVWLAQQCTPHFTLYTLHCTFHTLHSTLYLHLFFYTPHSTLLTLHSTLHTLRSTLSNPHSTLYPPHFTLHNLHFRLLTPHSTL